MLDFQQELDARNLSCPMPVTVGSVLLSLLVPALLVVASLESLKTESTRTFENKSLSPANAVVEEAKRTIKAILIE